MVLLGTALLGLASGIAGTFAVLRKESLIGDGLSHAALPGVVIAFLLTGIKDIEVLITGAALSSITAAWLITITVENSKIKFDGALMGIVKISDIYAVETCIYIEKDGEKYVYRCLEKFDECREEIIKNTRFYVNVKLFELLQRGFL